MSHYTGLEIISRLASVNLSDHTYFCSDTTSFWPDKYPLRHLFIKVDPPPPPSAYRTSAVSKLLGPVHTYSDVFENGDFYSVSAFRPHVNGVFRFSKTVPRVECFENTDLSFSCGRTKTEIFEYNDVIDRVHSIPVCILRGEKTSVTDRQLVSLLLGLLSSLIACIQ